jgi:hypothetical protein
MSGNKTRATDASVKAFIDAVEDPVKQQDAREMVETMRAITGSEPRLWGTSIVGFGKYRYEYASGRKGEFFITGFSPRKTALAVYVMPGFERYRSQLGKLGPHKTGKSCLYLKRLDAIDREVLAVILRDSVGYMRKKYECE